MLKHFVVEIFFSTLSRVMQATCLNIFYQIHNSSMDKTKHKNIYLSMKGSPCCADTVLDLKGVCFSDPPWSETLEHQLS